MARTVGWNELKTGTIGLAILVTIALGTLIFARVGALHGDTGTLYILTDRATGVLGGTEVWLSGEKVGLVKQIHFRVASTDTSQRLAIETEILADRLGLIRTNSRADIRPGGNLIGSPVVYLSSGTSESPAVRSGDTLVTSSYGPVVELAARVDSLAPRLTALADTSRRLIALLSAQTNTIGAFARSGLPRATTAASTASGLMDKAVRGSGTTGLAMRGNFQARLTSLMAATDSIALLLSTGSGNVGRFRSDSTLLQTAERIGAGIDSLRALFSTTGGTMARARGDSSLTLELARTRIQLDSLIREIKRKPLRFLSP